MAKACTYSTLSATDLLTALEQSGRNPHPNLIQECVNRRKEITPTLLEFLADTELHDWPDKDPRWYRTIHAGLLLCAYREPQALPLFAEIINDPERETLLEWFDIPLPMAYGLLALDTLLRILNNKKSWDTGRVTTTEMLTLIALHWPQAREQVIAALQSLLPPLNERGNLVFTSAQRRDPPELWTWAVMGLMDLRDQTSQAQVLQMFRHRLIHEWIFGSQKEYLEAFEPDAPPPSAARVKEYDILAQYK